MELDIYIPSIHTGIEFDGANWHQSDEQYERDIRKYKLCQENHVKLIRIKEKNTRNWVDNAQTADVVYTISKVKKTGELETALKVILDSIDASSNMWTRTDPRHIHSQIDVNIERDRPQILGYLTSIDNSLAILRPDVASKWDYLYDLFGVEIKIGGLPVVDQHRAAFVLPWAAADVAPQKAVVLLGKRGQTLCRKGEDHLRGVKGLARLQVPRKAFLLNAAHYPDKPGLRALHVHLVAAGIDHHHPVAGTAGFRCILPAEDQEGIIVVAGAAPHRRNGLDIGAHSLPLQLPLHGVSAVEMQQILKNQIERRQHNAADQTHHYRVADAPLRLGDFVLPEADADEGAATVTNHHGDGQSHHRQGEHNGVGGVAVGAQIAGVCNKDLVHDVVQRTHQQRNNARDRILLHQLADALRAKELIGTFHGIHLTFPFWGKKKQRAALMQPVLRMSATRCTKLL
jgi:hypothetical protein